MAGWLALVVLLATTGCLNKTENSGVQGFFTKNGIIVKSGREAAVAEVHIRVNEQDQAVSARSMGKNTVLLPLNWQAGDNYQVIFDKEKWNSAAPGKPAAWLSAVVPTGELEAMPTINQWAVEVNEGVAVAPDGQFVAVASFDHTVYLFDRSGKKIWDYRVPSGMPVSVAFSADGSIVLAGESSSDGKLYAFDRLTGKILWDYAFAADIGKGMSAQWSNRPNVRSLVVNGDAVIAAGQHRQRVVEKNGERSLILYPTQSVIIAFDIKTGQKRWRYPENETMDTGVSKIVVSADGEKVAFGNQSWSPAEKYPDGGIRVLNGGTGKMAAFFQASVINPYFAWVGIHEGIDISANGRYLAIFASDNQAMLFDLGKVNMAETGQAMEPEWIRQVSKVHAVGGVPVYASGSAARVTDEGKLYFMTSNTFVADKTAASAPPFLHPDSATLFSYNKNGELLWRWQTEGGVGKVRFSADNRFMVAAVYHNYISQSNSRAGIYCFDLRAEGPDSLAWFYPVEGVASVADIAADGTTIAGCEAPIRMKGDTVTGQHRLHILQ
ncbi:outer membrane protein assembly factor BamB [Methylomusa anaerophila]|uniref:Outer membrane protein assembly factor BamB n=1 Tax=Methylomusa anaerophila TaxID=1930071 RepID=A0A348AEA6_9FIRM|nr:outer membrane protein assembly factor BamB [Methylomusa anaerophila]